MPSKQAPKRRDTPPAAPAKNPAKGKSAAKAPAKAVADSTLASRKAAKAMNPVTSASKSELTDVQKCILGMVCVNFEDGETATSLTEIEARIAQCFGKPAIEAIEGLRETYQYTTSPINHESTPPEPITNMHIPTQQGEKAFQRLLQKGYVLPSVESVGEAGGDQEPEPHDPGDGG